MEINVDKLFTEQTQRSEKENNVDISRIDLDSLKERESASSIVTNLIDSVDESATIVDCKKD